MTKKRLDGDETRGGFAGRTLIALCSAGPALIYTATAEAYVGPGAGLGVLGVVFAVLAGLVMAVVGLVLWPIRMIAHKRKMAGAQPAEAEPAEESVRQAEPAAVPQDASPRS